MTKLELVTSELVVHLEKLSKEAVEIHWITAFAMKSGISLILPFLQDAATRKVPIKLLVGDYLFVTQPSALEMLLEQLPEAEVRLWKSGGVSFHPKSYLFRGTENSHLIVGSSNLSASAFTRGVEWNLIAPTSVDNEVFEEAVKKFHQYFYGEQTIPLNRETLEDYTNLHKKANIQRPISPVWSEAEEVEMTVGPAKPQEIEESPAPYTVEISPRPAQQEALEALDDAMAEDYSRAMVVLATGLGKTYLAAFFAAKFKRVLFVAHREEILSQAKHSFEHVHPDRTNAFYNASEKKTDADFIFASIYTLGSQYHLDCFEPDAFVLIEVKRTGMTKSYKMVVLSYMLSKGENYWLDPITPQEAAPYFHQYLTEKDDRLNTDFSDAQGKRLRQYDEKSMARLIAEMPMAKWSGSAKDGLVTFERGVFRCNINPVENENHILYLWTQQIAEYRLHGYFERKGSSSLLN